MMADTPSITIAEPHKDEYQVVPSIDGLYDDKAEDLTADISDRKHCLRHQFINASLHWGLWAKGFVPLEAENRPRFHRAWGSGYGGIRFCKNCKQIDCIHDFTDQCYEVKLDQFYSDQYIIGHCAICKCRILRSHCGCFRTSQEALDLIVKVAKEMGKPFTGNPLTDGWGSGYYLEFPYRVSHLLLESTQAAEAFIRLTFARGQIDIETMSMRRR